MRPSLGDKYRRTRSPCHARRACGGGTMGITGNVRTWDEPLTYVQWGGEVMRAMILDAPRQPLRLAEAPLPAAGTGQVLIRVHACAVCRTDLHIVDGELPDPKLPLIPGHEIVGTIVELGPEVEGLAVGARVGVPWLGWTC